MKTKTPFHVVFAALARKRRMQPRYLTAPFLPAVRVSSDRISVLSAARVARKIGVKP